MELKRCPICGSKPLIDELRTMHVQIICTHCYQVEGKKRYDRDFRGSYSTPLESASESWNEKVDKIEKYLKNKQSRLDSDEEAIIKAIKDWNTEVKTILNFMKKKEVK